VVRILLFGARDWEDVWPIALVVEALVKRYGARHLLVIEGGAPGADTIAGGCAMAAGVHVAEVTALWDSYSRSAGPRRNGVMASLEPRLAVGFHRDITTSKGTASMAGMTRKAGIPTVIVPDRLTALKLSRRLLHARTDTR
jgi:hypothetical protein